jgi:DNA-binding IclR family transcriptional regulator
MLTALHQLNPDHSPSTYRVQVLDRALGILAAVAESSEGMGLGELSGCLSLHKSTIHRLLTVLEQHHLIRRNPRGKYTLGMKLFEWGSRAVASVDLRTHAAPFLRQLACATSETACVCVLSGAEMLSIANVEGPLTLRTTAGVGRRLPVHCTAVGKAFIAFLPERGLDSFLRQLPLVRRTRNTLVTRAVLKAELVRIRTRGFAVDHDENEEGLRCIGAPLRDYTGTVVASIAVEGPSFRLTDERLPLLAKAVMRAAHDLSLELGYGAWAHGNSAMSDRLTE